MLDRQTVLDRIQEMALRPTMFAATREGFVAGLAAYLDVLGVPPYQVQRFFWDCFERQGSLVLGTGDPLTKEHADRAVALARELLLADERSTP